MCHYKRVVAVGRTEKHMVTIIVDSSLSKGAIYRHTCTENIKMLYRSDGKLDVQQYLKIIIEAEMFTSPEVFFENSPI